LFSVALFTLAKCIIEITSQKTMRIFTEERKTPQVKKVKANSLPDFLKY